MESNSNSISNSNNRTVLSDEPSLSSAALCLSIHWLGSNFRPEFTHQCLENESFCGYQPLANVLEEERAKYLAASMPDDGKNTEEPAAAAVVVLHKTHLGHSHGDQELLVSITLAPSCRKCQVSIQTTTTTTTTTSTSCTTSKRNAENNNERDNRETKKLKAEDNDDDGDDHPESSSSTAAHETTNKLIDGSAAKKPLSFSEIRKSIAKALPEIVEDESSCRDDYLSHPLGEVLTEYKTNEKTFIITLANGEAQDVTAYHSQVQPLALWFIENADDVDVSNHETGGFWKVLYLYQKHNNNDVDNNNDNANQYSLVGYMTLFHFFAPFHKPEPGIVVRICQALVLPTYQGQGHGKRLMQALYDLVHHGQKYYTDGQAIVQVNVEDPAPGFIALRNKMDLQLLNDHPEWWPAHNKDATDEAFFTAVSEKEALDMSSKSKVTPHQIHIVNELVKLQSLMSEQQKTTTDSEELEKRFRLMVKKRLNKEHREDMSAFPTKDQKKAFLANLFDEQYQSYQALLMKRNKP